MSALLEMASFYFNFKHTMKDYARQVDGKVFVL